MCCTFVSSESAGRHDPSLLEQIRDFYERETPDACSDLTSPAQPTEIAQFETTLLDSLPRTDTDALILTPWYTTGK